MAKYAQLTDLPGDDAIDVTDAHLSRADLYVDAALIERGITPGNITLPQPLLTELAVNIASRLAAVEQSTASGDSSPLIAKAKEYQKTVDMLLQTVNLQSVGLAYPTNSSFASFTIGRG